MLKYYIWWNSSDLSLQSNKFYHFIYETILSLIFLSDVKKVTNLIIFLGHLKTKSYVEKYAVVQSSECTILKNSGWLICEGFF